jgi:Bifunctional DNA primase/polymerase, N-terminal
VAADDPLLAAALDYAVRGWHVFPLRPDDKRPAFPDHDAEHCPGPRRDPRCRDRHVGWEARATTDPDRIRRCWAAGPYGIGVACGPSGLVVVDLDIPKPGQDTPAQGWRVDGVNDGRDAFTIVCDRAGQLPPFDTYTVTTGSGGTHLYYTTPAGPRLGNTAGRLGWLIDTRGHGGYVVAAGSTVAGRAYRTLLDRPPAPLPGWLAGLLHTPPPAPPAAPVIPRSGRHGAYLAAAVDSEARRVQTAPAGQHNHTLYTAALLLGQLVAGGGLDEATVRAALLAAAAQRATSAGCRCTGAEAPRTITSGLRAGAQRPRTVAA